MSETHEDSVSSLPVTLLVLVVIIPLIILVVLFATNLYLPVGAALGVNLKRDDNVIIYDATCWQEASTQRLYLVYWSRDAAPLTVKFGELESPVITGEAGINTLDLSIYDQDQCPAEVTLTDKSRNRITGSSVERLDN